MLTSCFGWTRRTVTADGAQSGTLFFHRDALEATPG